MDKIVKPPKLSDQLQSLKVGQKVEISIEEYMPSTIRNCSSRLNKSIGMKFSVTTQGRRYSTIVERIS